MRGARADGAGTTLGLPAQRLAMWVMGEGLRGRIAEHIVYEAQQSVETLSG